MEGAKDSQAQCNVVKAITGLDTAALLRLAQAQSHSRSHGTCAEWMGKQVIYPAAANQDLQVTVPFHQTQAALPNTVLKSLWPQMQKWPYSAQWVHQPSTLLLNDTVPSASSGLSPSHVTATSGLQVVLALHQLQHLQKPLYDQGLSSTLYQSLDHTPSGGHPALVVEPVDLGKKPVFRQGMVQGPKNVVFKIERQEEKKNSAGHATAHATDAYTDSAYQDKRAEGSHLRNSIPNSSEVGKIPEGNRPHSVAMRKPLVVDRKQVNNSGVGEPYAVERGAQLCRTSGNDMAEALIGKLGDEAFQKMRALLLKQQEVFVSQVWDLHRLHWFQSYLQSSISPVPGQNKELEKIMSEAERPAVRTLSTVNNDPSCLGDHMGTGAVGSLERIESRNTLTKETHPKHAGVAFQDTISMKESKKEPAICGNATAQNNKLAERMGGLSKEPSEGVIGGPELVGSGKSEVTRHKLERRFTQAKSLSLCDKSFTDKAANNCCKDEVPVLSVKAAHISRGPHWHHRSFGARAGTEPEVSSSRMNADAAQRPRKDGNVKIPCGEKMMKERALLSQNSIDKAIGIGEESGMRTPQNETYMQPRKKAEVFKKKKRKSTKYPNMPAKVRKKSEKFNLLMECESIGSGRSGSSISNHSLWHTAPRHPTPG